MIHYTKSGAHDVGMERVRFLLTDESVGEGEFPAAWKERLEAVREGAAANLRAEMEKCGRKLEGRAGATVRATGV